MSNDAYDLVQAGVIGEQVDQFLKTDVGRYLDQCADVEIAEGLLTLKEANPYDTAAIHAAQARVWRGEHFKSWMREAVVNGLRAVQILEQRDSGEEP